MQVREGQASWLALGYVQNLCRGQNSANWHQARVPFRQIQEVTNAKGHSEEWPLLNEPSFVLRGLESQHMPMTC